MTDEQLLERIAREMSRSNGYDPDELTPTTGYSLLIPRWHQEMEWAARFLAAYRLMIDLREGAKW